MDKNLQSRSLIQNCLFLFFIIFQTNIVNCHETPEYKILVRDLWEMIHDRIQYDPIDCPFPLVQRQNMRLAFAKKQISLRINRPNSQLAYPMGILNHLFRLEKLEKIKKDEKFFALADQIQKEMDLACESLMVTLPKLIINNYDNDDMTKRIFAVFILSWFTEYASGIEFDKGQEKNQKKLLKSLGNYKIEKQIDKIIGNILDKLYPYGSDNEMDNNELDYEEAPSLDSLLYDWFHKWAINLQDIERKANANEISDIRISTMKNLLHKRSILRLTFCFIRELLNCNTSQGSPLLNKVLGIMTKNLTAQNEKSIEDIKSSIFLLKENFEFKIQLAEKIDQYLVLKYYQLVFGHLGYELMNIL